MKIGFTGTRKGMSAHQQAVLRELLLKHRPTEFHHGDCIGADAEAHQVALEFRNIFIVIHPPQVEKRRAFCNFDGLLRAFPAGEILPPTNYLLRNMRIVDQTDLLIAAPFTNKEVMRGSGTWYTVRYARKWPESKEIRILER